MSCINIHGARSPSTIKRRYRMITRSISPLDRDKPKISYHQDNVNVAAPNSISLISNRIYSFEISRTTDPAYFLLHDLTLCTSCLSPIYFLEFQTEFYSAVDGFRFTFIGALLARLIIVICVMRQILRGYFEWK